MIEFIDSPETIREETTLLTKVRKAVIIESINISKKNILILIILNLVGWKQLGIILVLIMEDMILY